MGTLLSGQTLQSEEEILLVKVASLIKHRRAADTERSGKVWFAGFTIMALDCPVIRDLN